MKPSVRLFAVAAALVLVALLAYSIGRRSGGPPAVTSDPAASASARAKKAPRGWTTHEDAAGFSVQLPRDWSAASDPASGRVTLTGPEGRSVVVWPLFVPGALDAPSAGAVLARMAAKAAPDISWEEPQPAGEAALRAGGSAGDRAAVASMIWTASPKGAAAFAYVTTAPAADYAAEEETFARIVSSFRIAGASTTEGASAPQMSFVRWQDPREAAFSLEVPEGWNVQGGLFRFASVDTRGAVEITSPDGEIRVMGGDPDLPTFTEPNQVLQMSGFPEGSWYSPGYGVNMMVRRYVPGLAFAREYVSSKVAAGCERFTLVDARERADATAALNAIYSRFPGVRMEVTAGEVSFTCTRGGRAMSGYCFAGTSISRVPNGIGIWKAEMLHGYLAPAERIAEAQMVLDRGLRSFQYSPDWWAAQQHLTAETSRIVSDTQAQISQAIDDNYWSRQGVMDELSRRRSNAMLEVEDVVDPVYGREIQVESGSNYYWVDHRGTIVGTDTYTTPGIDFRELIRRP